MNKAKIILLFIILVLISGNIFFGSKYFYSQKNLSAAQIELQHENLNIKILDFTKQFIKKVLKADAEIDFETRLNLENSVRNLGDQEILTLWQKFTASNDSTEAQKNVLLLLEALVNKIN